MKTSNVRLGAIYQIKVGKNPCEVKIESKLESGDWLAIFVKSGKQIKICNTGRLLKCISKPTNISKKTKKADTSESDAKPVKPDCKLSLIKAAAFVLEACDHPLSCGEIVNQATKAGIWQLGRGKTPANTLYASILREIQTKGEASRFVKAGRGQFKLASNA